MKRLLMVFMFCFLSPIVKAEQAVYLLPISIETGDNLIMSNIFMSVKERKISTDGKEKYKMSKDIPGFDKANNASEAVASEVVDSVYKNDKFRYGKINKGLSDQNKTKIESAAGFGLLKKMLDYSDYAYFVNEYEMMGLKLYETSFAPTAEAKAQGFVNEKNSFFFLAVEETDSGIEHRFDALVEPVVQCLISAREYARKKEVKADLKELVKISCRPKFEGVKSASETVGFYVKIIQPAGDTLFFKDKKLVKTDFNKESNGIWKFYADFWSDLLAVPDVNGFQTSGEFEKFLRHIADNSGSRLRKGLQKWEGRHLSNYKFQILDYKKVLCAIDADPVYFVFYATISEQNYNSSEIFRRIPYTDYIGHETFFRETDGYKRVNWSYLSDLERLLDSEEFEHGLMKICKNGVK